MLWNSHKYWVHTPLAAVLPGADASDEGLGSVNLLRYELGAGGFKGGVHWGEGCVWCARAFR